MSGNNYPLLMSTLICSIMNKYLKLDVTMYGIMFGLISKFLSDFTDQKYSFDSLNIMQITNRTFNSCYEIVIDYKNNNEIDFSSIFIALISVLCIGVIIYCVVKCWIIPKYYVINIYNHNTIFETNTYIKNFPQYFTMPLEMDCGGLEMIVSQKDVSNSMRNSDTLIEPSSGAIIHVNDKLFNIKGTIEFFNKSIEVLAELTTQKKNITIKCMKFSINLSSFKTKNDRYKQLNEYFSRMSEENKKINNNRLRLYHVKIINDNEGDRYVNNIQVTYDGPSLDYNELNIKYLDTFFHPEKEKLWSILKKVDFDPTYFHNLGQSPHCGLLLHGPPGTGKSTFAYRVAMCLKRDIISVDIRSLKKRNYLFQIIRNPYVNGKNKRAKDVVFILDEFDTVVSELYYADIAIQTMLKKWNNKMVKQHNKLKNILVDDGSDSSSNLSTDTSDISVDQILDQIQDQDQDKEFLKSTRIENLNDGNIRLNDLLELLNGPVPNDGLIVIATTNKYDEIKNLCPALFRHGRLTPVYFGNAQTQTVQDISKYFFNRPIELITLPLNISTAQIMELVIESKLIDDNNESFNHFQTKINEAIFCSQ